MSDVDLHELANLPGAGAARAKLQEAGAWDPYADTGAPHEFTLLVTANYQVCEKVTVTARCLAEARRLATSRRSLEVRVDGCGALFRSD